MSIENNMNNYNKVTLKYFGEEGTYLEAEEEGMETKDVLDIACELAFNTVGYGLAHWDFVERSFNANNVLSEVHRYTLEDNTYYQIRFSKIIQK